MSRGKVLHSLAQGLAVVSFVLICWVAHRALQERTQCLNSSFISFVQIGSRRVENCLYESRLSLNGWRRPLTAEEASDVRALEVLEPLREFLPDVRPRLAVEVNLATPHVFEIGHGFIRLGREWLGDPLQTRRGLIMGLLKRDQPLKYSNPFQLETITDFLLMSLFSLEANFKEVKFPTSGPSFAQYCKSPFRSLAHFDACAGAEPDSVDLQSNVWGFRPLLAKALAKVFNKMSLVQKVEAFRTLRDDGHAEPLLRPLRELRVSGMVEWFETALQEQLNSLKMRGTETAVQQTLKELDVQAPTHWELTFDITQTPAWKEILQQLKTYSQYRKRERTLVFTPEGAVALPSGLPVAWAQEDISSQTHVLIACQWPKPGEVVNVAARHTFARQSCGKMEDVFWN